MATSTQGAASAKIAVPHAYQEYLVAGRDRFAAVLVAAVIGLVFSWPGHVDIVTLITVAVPLLSWLLYRRRQWHYAVTEKEITVLWAQGQGWFWGWRIIFWKRTPITGYEQAEWRGLPALRLLDRHTNPKRRPDWLIVYAPEDAEYVRTQVLPLIDRYRRHW